MKRICWLLSAPSLVILAACTPPTMTADERADRCGPEPTTDDAVTAVQGWVDNSGLKDPFSAQTRDVKVGWMGGIKNGLINGGEWRYGWTISFLVNAKNSYGAYTGWHPRYLVWNRGQCWWVNTITGDDPRPPSPL